MEVQCGDVNVTIGRLDVITLCCTEQGCTMQHVCLRKCLGQSKSSKTEDFFSSELKCPHFIHI